VNSRGNFSHLPHILPSRGEENSSNILFKSMSYDRWVIILKSKIERAVVAMPKGIDRNMGGG
jgi:hypothetical protein